MFGMFRIITLKQQKILSSLQSSLFFEHYKRILLCEWVIELGCIRLIDSMPCHNAFAFDLDSISLGISALLRSSFVASIKC